MVENCPICDCPPTVGEETYYSVHLNKMVTKRFVKCEVCKAQLATIGDIDIGHEWDTGVRGYYHFKRIEARMKAHMKKEPEDEDI